MSAGPKTSIAEAEHFLWNHPWATTDIDNPVDLLREVVSEATQLIERLDEVEHRLRTTVHREREPIAAAQLAELVAFIRRLNAEAKISDFELREALAIAKCVPSHLADGG